MTAREESDIPAEEPDCGSLASAERKMCPECGAEVGERDVCWLCGWRGGTAAPVHPARTSPFVPKSESSRRANPAQFSLESLMLAITLISVCLGMLVAVPGLGVLVCIIAVPAFVRTLIVGRLSKDVAVPLSLSEKVLAFFASSGIVLGILLAGMSAFAVACVGTCFAVLGVAQTTMTPGNAEGLAMHSALLAASVVSIGVIVWLAWITWPRRP